MTAPQPVLAVVLTIGVLAAPLAAGAQQARKVYRIGVVASTTHFTPAFQQGLRELGYVEGQNVIVEQRSTQGRSDRFPELVAEVIRLNVDVLVVSGIFGVRAAQKATTSIPIVFLGVGDPVGSGIVASLAHPGGNITGTSIALGEGFAGKWVQLLKEAAPNVSHVAVLWNSANPTAKMYAKEVEVAAQAVRVTFDLVDVRNPRELDGALAAIAASRARGLIVTGDPLFFSNRAKLLQFASTRQLPAIYFFRDFVDDGGLMAYGPSLADSFRRAATYVDKILRGARPADLPVEQPTKFELIINVRTAKTLGLTIPSSVLARADEVIE
jgi:putative ABC transport system substrate-binding protein